MLQKLNAFLQKWMPIITPTTVVLGVTVFTFVQTYSFLVTWIFAFISFASCLGLNIKEIKKAMSKPLQIVACIALIQVLIPAVAFGAGHLFFSGDPDTITGLLLAFIIPTGVVSLMWVSIYNGNRALTLSIVLVNTMISPIVVPLTLSLLVGNQVQMDTFGLMSGLFWMIVAPSILGIIITKVIGENTKKVSSTLAPFSKLGVIFVILINAAVVSPYFTSIDGRVILIGTIVFFIACGGYLIGLITARIFGWDKAVAISFMFNSGMRNNGAGAALAVTYFPPSVAFPIVLAILFQQFLASVSGKIAHYYFTNLEEKVVRIVKSFKVSQIQMKAKDKNAS
ncbi:bile acid:sodium symporter family protein [Evansella sp. AB-P1]|uniref:bile acid:sodium symporter family protein n=1 Tax=Evansella sp. AB-P1 TaxID=3037653 RepID=UPI00241D6B91|nr:bile acid:sodium symporter family protein [Evansella sp. AB-P1]MDG5787228.1 bile acid:sodium symporter family protein [Evansella sp. AB-P1]